VYKHVNRDSTKDEKEKSQYQDNTRSEAEEGYGDRPWEVLYDYVVDPATSQPSGAFPLTERTFPLAFLELMTTGIHILWPLRTLFCVLQWSLPPC